MRGFRRLVPRTFQGRLTLAFVAILALTLSLVTIGVLNRLGDYFDQQQRQDLTARSYGVAQYVALVAENASGVRLVVSTDNVLDPAVTVQLALNPQQRILSDSLAKADVLIRIGTLVNGVFTQASGGEFRALLQTSSCSPLPVWMMTVASCGSIVAASSSNRTRFESSAARSSRATINDLLSML